MSSEKAFILDQDGTIYSKESPLGLELSARTKQWLCSELSLSATGFSLFKKKFPNFIDGLQSHGLDLRVWHKNVLKPLSRDIRTLIKSENKLLEIFSKIDQSLYLVTFSSKEFTKSLLDALGCSDSFVKIFNLDAPNKYYAYRSVLLESKFSPELIKVFGDNDKYDLSPAKMLGMRTEFIEDGKTFIDYIK